MQTRKNDQRFPKSERVLKNRGFVHIQKIGRRFYSKHFILIIAKEDNETAQGQGSRNKISPKSNKARLGITITKKLEPTAVKRNRVKRMVREAFRQIKNMCTTGISIIVIAKLGSTELGTQEVRRQLFGVLKFNGYIL